MVFINYRMRLTFLLLVLCAVITNTKRIKKIEQIKDDASTAQELSKDSKSVSNKGPLQKAIIAIEIVDSNNASTKEGKSKKRTIESALGYGFNGGYQNFFNVKPKPPKYEVYKYSQHDIPAYRGPTKHIPVETYNSGTYQGGHSGHQNQESHRGSHRTHSNHANQGTHGSYDSHGNSDTEQFKIQKSLQYDLGSTAPVYIPSKTSSNLQQYYQNGATLFSTLDQNGHLSSLSSQVPSNHGPMVPVIIFRVYTNQLTQSGGLHPNIPNSHPYANLNNVDLQSLLTGYVQKHPEQQQENQYYHDEGASHHPQVYYPQGSTVEHQQYSQSHVHHDSGLQTNENYPDDAHTKVIFHKSKLASGKSRTNKNRPKESQGHAHSRPIPQKFKITIPENTFSKVEVQEHTYGSPTSEEQYVHQQAEQHYAHQQYEQQPQYYYQSQHYQQQEYQPSVHYQQVQQPQQQEEQRVLYDDKKYVQLATYPNQGDLPQQAPHQQQQLQHHAGEYYQQDVQYVQYENQPQEPQVAPVVPQQHYEQQTTNTAVHYLHNNSEQGTENQDYSLVKTSNDAGRDLNLKLYNYHAHAQRGTQKKKRERKTRIPLVLAPQLMESLKSQ